MAVAIIELGISYKILKTQKAKAALRAAFAFWVFKEGSRSEPSLDNGFKLTRTDVILSFCINLYSFNTNSQKCDYIFVN